MPQPENATKKDRRAFAREQVRKLHEAERTRQVRRRWIRQGLVLTLALGVGALAIGVTQSVQTHTLGTAAGPRNMHSDGLVLTQDGPRLTAAIGPNELPMPNPSATGASAPSIVMYLDYQCPRCKEFEQSYSDTITALVRQGATLEIHPIAVLSDLSHGTKYSERAANAFACVADNDPDKALAVNAALFAQQPEEGTSGLSDSELIDLVLGSGATQREQLESCITSGTFRNWVVTATDRARRSIPSADITAVTGTPTVIVNGQTLGNPFTDPALEQLLASG